MNDPSDEEINKTIVEFMHPGDEFSRIWMDTIYLEDPKIQGGVLQILRLYTTSLDALVPVWEKLGHTNTDIHFEFGYIIKSVQLKAITGNIITGEDKSIHRAAALATYKAIKEIGEE